MVFGIDPHNQFLGNETFRNLYLFYPHYMASNNYQERPFEMASDSLKKFNRRH